MYEIDMLEGALRSKDRRIAELERERDALRECLLEIVESVHGGGRVITVQDASLEEFEAALGMQEGSDE